MLDRLQMCGKIRSVLADTISGFAIYSKAVTLHTYNRISSHEQSALVMTFPADPARTVCKGQGITGADCFKGLASMKTIKPFQGQYDVYNHLDELEWKKCVKCGASVYTYAPDELVDCGHCNRPKTPPTLRQQWDNMRRRVAPKIYDRDGRVCAQCGSTDNLEIDHIIPLRHGGTNDLDNLQVLCIGCNRKKGSK
jgi:ribosomal protein S27AE